jgi:photosystem II CP47 chlorophyll apoprotein
VATPNNTLQRIPWFRAHIILLNDPGRLISVHIMHTSLVAGWASSMLIYELLILDSTDTIYNPIWRQGMYVVPFTNRLGVVSSVYGWSTGLTSNNNLHWSFETVVLTHLALSGLLILASLWHWSYWDLDMFVTTLTNSLVLDLNRVFSIHLALASITCLSFGIYHLTGTNGPGMWTSDSYSILGSIRSIKPSFSLLALTPTSFGSISSHHILAGVFGFIASIWHLSSVPGPSIYNSLSLGNIESPLSTSIVAVFVAAIITSSSMWYGSSHTQTELYGPTRYQWDNSYYSLDIESRVKHSVWNSVPDKLLVYDYIGCNPAKGGLFRSGPMNKSDGIFEAWTGHSIFSQGSLYLTVRRMPAFFETFPVILIDETGSVRADIAFRRASSSYSIEECKVTVTFAGGLLNGKTYSSPSIVKGYARKSQFGEIFNFDKVTSITTDGVFRTSSRGWYSFSHVTLALIFYFGHLWHASRALYRSVWTGVSMSYQSQLEYGKLEKLGDI